MSTKLNFEPINEEYIGFFAGNPDAASDMVNCEIALIGSFTEMEELSKQSHLYSDEKIKQFKNNNSAQQTLRETVEELNDIIGTRDKDIKRLND